MRKFQSLKAVHGSESFLLKYHTGESDNAVTNVKRIWQF